MSAVRKAGVKGGQDHSWQGPQRAEVKKGRDRGGQGIWGRGPEEHKSGKAGVKEVGPRRAGVSEDARGHGPTSRACKSRPCSRTGSRQGRGMVLATALALVCT